MLFLIFCLGFYGAFAGQLLEESQFFQVSVAGGAGVKVCSGILAKPVDIALAHTTTAIALGDKIVTYVSGTAYTALAAVLQLDVSLCLGNSTSPHGPTYCKTQKFSLTAGAILQPISWCGWNAPTGSQVVGKVAYIWLRLGAINNVCVNAGAQFGGFVQVFRSSLA